MTPRIRLFACGLVVMLLSCAPLSNLAGSAVPDGTSVLPDPAVGLDGLDDYQASLMTIFQGTRDGQAVDERQAHEQNVWQSPQAIFTSIEGQDENGDTLTLQVGTVGQAHYWREGDLPCFVRWEDQPATTYRPASTLWPIGAAAASGAETINETSALHYTLDRAALGLGEGVTASGDVWLAESGGYVVRYNLTIEAGEAYFGPGSAGRLQVDYNLTQANARPDPVYPDGCRPVYTGLPVLPQALELNRQPTVTMYAAETDLASARAFYEGQMAAAGWDLDAIHESQADRLGLLFAHPSEGLQAVIRILEQEPGVRVVASVFGLHEAPAATPGGATAASVSPPVRVMDSVRILLGSDQEVSVLPSYHLEVRHQAPTWSGSSVVGLENTVEADVHGRDVHFRNVTTGTGGGGSVDEAYLIDGQEYLVENGAVRAGIGMAKLTWSLWPLDAVAILGAGASGARLAGTEILEGRAAEVYDVEGTGLSGGMAGGLGLPVASASGKVWVDQQTGALLKAVLDYQAEVKDADRQVQGLGSGHLEIEVTRVGEVTVSLPGS